MIYPVIVKIDFSEVVRAEKTPQPRGLKLFINWVIKPFTIYLIGNLYNSYKIYLRIIISKLKY